MGAHNVHYDGAYDEESLKWRRIGAADKASNIQTLCNLANYRPNEIVEIGCGTGALFGELCRKRVGECW
jgi:precorrin-6B methylase 2